MGLQAGDLLLVGRDIDQVVAFPGVGLQVVQFVARGADVAEPRVRQCVELAPAEVIARVERLGVQAGVGHGRALGVPGGAAPDGSAVVTAVSAKSIMRV